MRGAARRSEHRIMLLSAIDRIALELWCAIVVVIIVVVVVVVVVVVCARKASERRADLLSCSVSNSTRRRPVSGATTK